MEVPAPRESSAGAMEYQGAAAPAGNQPAGSGPLGADPVQGDTVHIVGHGPAVVLEVDSNRSSGSALYKVQYPDGSEEAVERTKILSHQRPSTAGNAARILTTGPRQLEYLGRAFDADSRNVSSRSATFSLIATMVGGGVLSLPYAMSQCGLILGTVALIVSAICSAWTLDMLVECARCTGRDTFDLIAHAAYGDAGKKATVGLVFMLCWLTQIAYFVLMADLLVPAVDLLAPAVLDGFPEPTARKLVLTVAALLVSPMCVKNNLSALRFMCFASVGSVLVVSSVVVYRAISAGSEHPAWIVLPNLEIMQVTIKARFPLYPESLSQAVYVIPMFGVSFLCHFNALPTHQELRRPTRFRIRKVFLVTLCFTGFLYFCVAISGFIFAGRCTCANILQNFAQTDRLVAFGRCALGAVLMLNFPLICQPCRNAFFRVLSDAGLIKTQELEGSAAQDMQVSLAANGSIEGSARVHVYRREDTKGEMSAGATLTAYDAFIPRDETVQRSAGEPTTVQRFVLTAVLLASSLLISLYMKSVMVVWSVLGSTVAFLIAFILPGAYWCRLVGPTVKPWRLQAARTLVLVTIVLALVCTVLTVMKLGAAACPQIKEEGGECEA